MEIKDQFNRNLSTLQTSLSDKKRDLLTCLAEKSKQIVRFTDGHSDQLALLDSDLPISQVAVCEAKMVTT